MLISKMSTDHLVLRIQEVVRLRNAADRREDDMFIFYDPVSHYYHIRGKAYGRESEPYSFSCEKSRDVKEFVKMIMCNNDCDISFINYSDLPFSSDEITYDMLSYGHSEINEIFGYDNGHLTDLEKYLRVIRFVRNEYVEV